MTRVQVEKKLLQSAPKHGCARCYWWKAYVSLEGWGRCCIWKEKRYYKCMPCPEYELNPDKA